MNEPTPPAAATSDRSIGRVIAGIVFIAAWTVIHVVLAYLFLASGVLLDIMLNFLRAFMFPGTSATLSANHELFGWTGILKAGLIVAGVAGVPAGLAFFWRSRRKVLMWSFWITLFAGAMCELYAVYILATVAFSN